MIRIKAAEHNGVFSCQSGWSTTPIKWPKRIKKSRKCDAEQSGLVDTEHMSVQSAITLRPMIVEVSHTDHVATVQSSATKPFMVTLMRTPKQWVLTRIRLYLMVFNVRCSVSEFFTTYLMFSVNFQVNSCCSSVDLRPHDSFNSPALPASSDPSSSPASSSNAVSDFISHVPVFICFSTTKWICKMCQISSGMVVNGDKTKPLKLLLVAKR